MNRASVSAGLASIVSRALSDRNIFQVRRRAVNIASRGRGAPRSGSPWNYQVPTQDGGFREAVRPRHPVVLTFRGAD